MMNRVELAFAGILLPLDYAALVLAAFVAYTARFDSFFAEYRPAVSLLPYEAYMDASLVVALVWIPIFALAGLYSLRGTRKITEEFARIFLACSTGVLVVILAIFFRRELFASRFVVIAAWLFAVLFVLVARVLILQIQRVLFRRGIGSHRVVIVGGDSNTEELMRAFRQRPSMGYLVVRHFNTYSESVRKELKRVYDTEGFHEILQVDPSLSREATEELLTFAEDRHLIFKYIADVFATHARNISMTTIAGVPIVEVHRTRLEGWGKIVKRGFDIVVSLMLLILLSPVLLCVALAIKVDSRGPVFFSRSDDDGSLLHRVGEHGRAFRYFKFRSMRIGAHALRPALADRNVRKGGPLFKVKDDPRITRVGAFIRRFSIDEFPELFLVLKGDMSLVGPRPHLPEEVNQYQRHHRRVLTIKPGMTGLAQISGRSDLSFDEEVRLDTYYVENWSLWLDIYILMRTPIAVLSKRTAE